MGEHEHTLRAEAFRSDQGTGVRIVDQEDMFARAREDLISELYPPTVKFILGARLPAPFPAVITAISRSNWLDYSIYIPKGSEVQRVFSIACRDENTIRWMAKGGRLVGFEVDDKWEPVPKRLQHPEPHHARWMEVTIYRWDSKRGTFCIASTKWTKTPIATPFPNQREQLPKRFSFKWG